MWQLFCDIYSTNVKIWVHNVIKMFLVRGHGKKGARYRKILPLHTLVQVLMQPASEEYNIKSTEKQQT